MKAVDQLEVLTYARGLVARNWAKRTLARDIWGLRVPVSDPRARSFCAVGAISRAEIDLALSGPCQGVAGYKLPIPNLPKYAMGFAVGMFNDNSTKQQVLAMFDARIAELRKEIDARPETHTPDVVSPRKAVARVPRFAPWPIDDEPRTHRPLVGSVQHRG